MDKRLSPQDQQRVDEYLQLPQHRDDRAPFRMWYLFGFLWLILLAMGGLSYWLAHSHGVV